MQRHRGLACARTALAAGHVNEFEAKLLYDSLTDDILLAVTPGLLQDLFAARITAAFRALNEIAGQSAPGPHLVFVHVLNPHAPFVFDGDGVAPDLPCAPQCRPETSTRLAVAVQLDASRVETAPKAQHPVVPRRE